MEAGLPEEDSPESREGTLLHDYLAHPEYERAVLKPNQQDLLKLAGELEQKVFETAESEFSLTSSDHAERREIEAQFENLPGHIDLLRVYSAKKIAVIIDDKLGYITVERAELNIQLRSYSTMVTKEVADIVIVAIVQPRLSYSERITMAKYTRADIEAAQAQIRDILAKSDAPDAPLNPGEEQCRNCKAKLICPDYREFVSKNLAIVQTDRKLTKAAREGQVIARITQCSDEQLGLLKEAVSLASFVSDPVSDEMRRRIAAGQLTDWKTSKPIEKRKIVDGKRAMSILNLKGKFTKDEVWGCCPPPSVTKLEETLREKTKCGWKEARDYVNETLASVIEVTEEKPRVLRQKPSAIQNPDR